MKSAKRRLDEDWALMEAIRSMRKVTVTTERLYVEADQELYFDPETEREFHDVVVSFDVFVDGKRVHAGTARYPVFWENSNTIIDTADAASRVIETGLQWYALIDRLVNVYGVPMGEIKAACEYLRGTCSSIPVV